jgi:hypothetical protein
MLCRTQLIAYKRLMPSINGLIAGIAIHISRLRLASINDTLRKTYGCRSRDYGKASLPRYLEYRSPFALGVQV